MWIAFETTDFALQSKQSKTCVSKQSINCILQCDINYMYYTCFR